MARSFKKPIVRQHSSSATRLYNRKVRAHNNQKLRHAVANDLLGEDIAHPFQTKTVFNDYDYCDARFVSDEVKHSRK
jgi:transcriptional regulator of met regulon